jgi:iron complex outermembrane recepter protein
VDQHVLIRKLFAKFFLALFLFTLVLRCGIAQEPDQNPSLTGEFEVNIESLPLLVAVKALSDQTGLEVLFYSDVASGVFSQPVSGRYTGRKALDAMLEGTHLQSVDLGKDGALGIRPEQVEQDPGKSLPASRETLSAQAETPATAKPIDPADGTANSSKLAIEEIIVTAGKRGTQNPQDIAASISAVDTSTLEKVGADGFEDYLKLFASLHAVNSGPGQSQIIMRGVNSGRVNHNQPQARSLVGLYIDETPVSDTGFNPDVDLFDIDRIEVLRGPQGTLYGASSMSGTIRLITVQPKLDEWGVRLEAGASLTHDGGANHTAKGMINLPIIEDVLAIRGSFNYRDDSGYIDNVETGETDYNDAEATGGHVSVLWILHEGFTAKLSALYQDLESNGRPDEYVPNAADPRLAGVNGELETRKFFADTFDNEFSSVNLTLTMDVPWGVLTSSSSYTEMNRRNFIDDSFRVRAFFGPDLISSIDSQVDSEDFSQEIRLSTDAGKQLGAVIGLFYQNQERTFDVDQFILEPVPAFLTRLTSRFGPPDSISIADSTNELEQIALFGELTWKVTDKLALTGGLRWFDYAVHLSSASTGLVNGGPGHFDGSFEEDGVTPTYIASYRLTDEILFYGSASKGFRVGGVTDGVFPSTCDADLSALGWSAPPGGWKSDELWNFEAGMKSTWLDGRAVLNTAIYHIDWSDIQSVRRLSCGFQFTDNAADLEVDGVDVETAFALSETSVVQFALNYNDARLSRTSDNFGASKGARAPFVPQWIMVGSFDYSRPMAGGNSAFARADIRYTGSSFSEFSASNPLLPLIELPAYTTIDLVAGVQFGKWTVSAFAKNITDERVVTNVDPERNQPAQFSIARPRTLGARVSLEF